MRIVVSVAEDTAERVLVSNVLDAAHHRREKWVGHVGDDHPHNVGLIAAKTSCQLAGLITEATNRFHIPAAAVSPELWRSH